MLLALECPLGSILKVGYIMAKKVKKERQERVYFHGAEIWGNLHKENEKEAITTEMKGLQFYSRHG